MVLSLALGVKASTVSAAWAIGAYKSLAKPCKPGLAGQLTQLRGRKRSALVMCTVTLTDWGWASLYTRD